MKKPGSIVEITTEQYIIQVFNKRWLMPNMRAVTCRVTDKDLIPLDRFDCMLIDSKYIAWTCDTYSDTRKQLRETIAKVLNGG